MRVLAAITALAAATQARITGFKAPKKIAIGSPVEIVWESEIYIQEVNEIGAQIGYSPHQWPESIGTLIESVFIGKARSNQVSGFNSTIYFPGDLPYGEFTLTAGIAAAYGVSGSMSIVLHNATVEFGDETSDEYVYSTWFENINSPGCF